MRQCCRSHPGSGPDVLTLTNLPEARLNRAIARFNCQEFAGAEADYDELKKSGAEIGPVAYGLAAIADHRHDTNQTVSYLWHLPFQHPTANAPLAQSQRPVTGARTSSRKSMIRARRTPSSGTESKFIVNG